MDLSQRHVVWHNQTTWNLHYIGSGWLNAPTATAFLRAFWLIFLLLSANNIDSTSARSHQAVNSLCPGISLPSASCGPFLRVL
ncbi:hypothetical protein DL93DRAFT_2089799 [Clavulina sp. PMI_390]|nr:hypothetical protein DL93DRAFT_2089799 [Clavulina sp. PMI_390]